MDMKIKNYRVSGAVITLIGVVGFIASTSSIFTRLIPGIKAFKSGEAFPTLILSVIIAAMVGSILHILIGILVEMHKEGGRTVALVFGGLYFFIFPTVGVDMRGIYYLYIPLGLIIAPYMVWTLVTKWDDEAPVKKEETAAEVSQKQDPQA